MRNIVLLLIVFVTANVRAQQDSKVTTFHRMLILNKDQELLVVKLKNYDLWVTPGLYQNSKQTIKQGIDSIASTYGLKIKDIQLRGVYGLTIPAKSTYSTRNIFQMYTDDVINKLPTNIEEYKWIKVENADKVINIPHINELILDVFNNSKNIRGGTIEMKTIDKKRTSKIIEKFYSLTKD